MIRTIPPLDEVRPPQPPRKPWVRRHWVLTIVLVAAGLGLLGGIASALGGNKPAAKVSTAPVPTVTVTQKAKPAKPAPTVTVKPRPAPTVTVKQSAPAQQPVTTAPAAPPADTILYRFPGTGTQTTSPFTITGDGNWHLSWAYTNGSLFAGQSENFQVYEYNSDGTLTNVLVNALAIGHGSPTATSVYNNAGTHYFEVNTEDASWELVVVSGSS